MSIVIEVISPDALNELTRAIMNGNVLFVKSVSNVLPDESKVTVELVVGPRWKDIR